MRILIVEDELHLAEALAQILKKHNYNVDAVNDGEAGLDNALTGIYDLIILDIMLPRMDGISVIKNMRKEGIPTPVILLTAKGEISDRVTGLDSGADDYLPKPFATEELLARIRALSRRKGEVQQVAQTPFGRMMNVTTCPRCRGEGKIAKQSCAECHGAGVVQRRRKIKVKIPAGVDTGMRVRAAGEGTNEGAEGGDLVRTALTAEPARLRWHSPAYCIFPDAANARNVRRQGSSRAR
jgi:CheY-like chemotaxis protein